MDKKGREHARKVVSEFYEKLYRRKLGHFPRTEDPETSEQSEPSVMRYAVPRAELEKLFVIPVKGRGAGDRFVKLALELNTGSPLVPYDGFNSAVGDSILLSSTFDGL